MAIVAAPTPHEREIAADTGAREEPENGCPRRITFRDNVRPNDADEASLEC
jgi:hypothetical protein